MSLFALSLVLVCIGGAVFGQIILKKGMNEVGEQKSLQSLFSKDTFFKIITNKYLVGGVLLYAFLAVLWLGALSSLDVSYIYPLLSIAYVLVAIGAFVFLKENVTAVRWAGIILIALGSFLITRT